jgi:Zn-dependent alcohol dehydrogenase
VRIEAVVLRKAGAPETAALDLDETLDSDAVLLRVIAAGLCGSDYKLATTADTYLPTVLGHEVLGVVEKVGDGVGEVASGDVVIPTVTPSCGDCRHCHDGFANLCLSGGSVVAGPLPGNRFTLADPESGDAVGQYCFLGGFATHLVTMAKQLIKVPPELIATPEACILGCVASTGAGAVFYSPEISSASTVGILGCGGVGASALLAAKAIDAGTILVVESNPHRRRLAEQMGAEARDPSEVSSLAETCDIVFEATSVGAKVNEALTLTRRGGTCVALGMPSFEGRLDLDYWDLASAQKTLRGTVTSTRSPEIVISRMIELNREGRLPFERMVDKRIDFSDIPAELADFPRRDHLKSIVLMPTA